MMDGTIDGSGMLWDMSWSDLLIVALGIVALAALTKYLFFRARIAAKP